MVFNLDELKAAKWWLNVLIAACLVMGTWMAVSLLVRRRQILTPEHPLTDDQTEGE